jgi:hypothetical protein
MIPNISRNSFDPETRGTGSGLVQRTELLLTRADVGPGAFVSGIRQGGQARIRWHPGQTQA